MKNTLLKLAFPALLSTGAPSASAQKMITFDSREVPAAAGRHRSANGKNSLSLGIASWLNGYTPVYYERTIAGIFSIQIGAGFTTHSYFNDFGMLIWNDGRTSSNRFNEEMDIEDHYESYKFRKAGIGPYLSLAPKIYLDPDEVMDGVYISPVLEYKSYHFQARKADETVVAENSYYMGYNDSDIPHTNDEVAEHMNCFDYTFNIGGHYQTRSNVALGWNIGVGGRSTSSRRLDLGLMQDDNGDYHYANNVTAYTKTKPLFVFNFTLGGWF